MRFGERLQGSWMVKTLTYRDKRFNLNNGIVLYKIIIFVLDLNSN